MNRESWLEEAVKVLKPLFVKAEMPCPDVRVSCGFPSVGALSPKKRRIGECWDGLMSKDGKPQLFISPLLVETGSAGGVLATLVHEMVHAAIGNKAGHGPKFKKAMVKIGLEGKPTSTTANSVLVEHFQDILTRMENYPHSELILTKERKVQTVRMHKCECPECGYTIRLAKKWLDVGIPDCPASHHKERTILMLEEKDENNE